MLYHERLGPAGAPQLLLIRGLGTQLSEWPRSLLDGLLARGFGLLLADNRDAGLSPEHAGESYSLRDMAADHVALLDHLGLERVQVCGISMGGMIAQHLALGWPQRLRAMASVMSSSGAPDLPRPTPEVMAALTEQPADTSEEAVVALSAAHRALFGSPGYPEDLATREAAARAAYRRAYRPDGVARQYAAILADNDRHQRLAEIRVPTTVIHGRDDPLVPLAAGEDTARRIPGARLVVVDGMGHNIPEALGGRIAAAL